MHGGYRNRNPSVRHQHKGAAPTLRIRWEVGILTLRLRRLRPYSNVPPVPPPCSPNVKASFRAGTTPELEQLLRLMCYCGKEETIWKMPERRALASMERITSLREQVRESCEPVLERMREWGVTMCLDGATLADHRSFLPPTGPTPPLPLSPSPLPLNPLYALRGHQLRSDPSFFLHRFGTSPPLSPLPVPSPSLPPRFPPSAPSLPQTTDQRLQPFNVLFV